MTGWPGRGGWWWRAATLGLVTFLLGGARGAWAQAETRTSPFNLEVTNVCTGEVLLCEGTTRVTEYHHVDERSGVHYIFELLTYASCEGTSGTRCHFQQNVTGAQEIFFMADGGAAYTGENYLRVVCAGPGNDFDASLRWHQTFNNNGDLTNSRYELEGRACREPGAG